MAALYLPQQSAPTLPPIIIVHPLKTGIPVPPLGALSVLAAAASAAAAAASLDPFDL